MKYIILIAAIAIAGCTAHDIEPYKVKVDLTVQSQEGALADLVIMAEYFEMPKAESEVIKKVDDCLVTKERKPQQVACSVKHFHVRSYKCVNCGK